MNEYLERLKDFTKKIKFPARIKNLVRLVQTDTGENYGFLSEVGPGNYTVKMGDIIDYDISKGGFLLKNGKRVPLNKENVVIRKGRDYKRLFK